MNIKPIAQETNLTSATDVGLASIVRLNNTGSATLVTIKTGATVYATFTIGAGEILLVEKDPSQTIEGGGSILAVKVAYSK